LESESESESYKDKDKDNKFNLINNDNSNENYNFIDKKIKSLFSYKFDNTFENHKNKSFLTLMNFSTGINYFLNKSNDFNLVNEYLNVIDLQNDNENENKNENKNK